MKKLLFIMGAATGAGAYMLWNKKKPNMMNDMKHGVKKAAKGISDFMD